MKITLPYSFCLSALIAIGVTAQAQKLADVQEKGMIAPEKVKVDGKLTEWPAAFQAYNKATMVYYTIANDAKNLYLVVQSSDKTTTNKIMRGGITFAINTDGKKKEDAGPSITFPVAGSSGMRSFSQARPAGGGGEQVVRFQMEGTPDQMLRRVDSTMAEANKRQIAALKEIKVFRLNGVTDSLISIYNEYGIKAMASIDEKGVFSYELAVPLEALGLSDNPKEFVYNLKLNGLQANMRLNGSPAAGGGGERIVMMAGPGGGGAMPRGLSDMMSMMSPTFFWGKYSLVKK